MVRGVKPGPRGVLRIENPPRGHLRRQTERTAGMLALSVKRNGTLMIGDDIRVKVIQIQSHQVRLGIEAPDGLPVDREEVRLSKIATGRHTPARRA